MLAPEAVVKKVTTELCSLVVRRSKSSCQLWHLNQQSDTYAMCMLQVQLMLFGALKKKSRQEDLMNARPEAPVYDRLLDTEHVLRDYFCSIADVPR